MTRETVTEENGMEKTEIPETADAAMNAEIPEHLLWIPWISALQENLSGMSRAKKKIKKKNGKEKRRRHRIEKEVREAIARIRDAVRIRNFRKLFRNRFVRSRKRKRRKK